MVRTLWLATLAATLVGCQSATKTISGSAAAIDDEAVSSQQRFETIEAEAQKPEPDLELIQSEAAAGIKSQKRIQLLVDIILIAVTQVIDKQSPLWRILLVFGFVSGGIVVLIILWRTGLGFVIRRIMMNVGAMIPKAKMNEVDMDLQIERGEMEHAAAVEAKSKDPAYRAARRKLNKKKE